MHITLIGISNVGKSHWARRLNGEGGFDMADCDHLIAQKLAPELAAVDAKSTALWMGHPYDSRYAAASRKYLACEEATLHEIIEKLRGQPKKPLVVDATGSLIYMKKDILEALKESTRVIYLAASREHADILFANYEREPKSLIWADAYKPHPGEAPHDALRRCYADLLESRVRHYRNMAHVTVPYDRHRDPNADWRVLIE